MSDTFSLGGRLALVTGANTGIGQAIAAAMAQAGAEVICAGRSSMAATLEMIAARGGRGRTMALDVTAPISSFDQIFAENPVDILVNNAGIIRRADAVDFTEADWDAVMGVNLKAVFFLCQAFARAAFARNATGAIVNVASLLSLQGGIRVSSYTASKHGVLGLTRLLANEWAAKGINVNAVAPGYVETNNTEALRADPDRSRAILHRIPAGRWGRPDDIAGAAVFLASPAARYIHGAILPVDGGWMAR
jgi:2-dehydro-3-deoxy-D-gluconate 5-dehydrogenase